MAPSDAFSPPASPEARPDVGLAPQPAPPAAAVPSRAEAPPPGSKAPPASPPSPAMTLLALVVVSALGFLLASFPAHNTDLLAHLAAGRRLVGLEISFTADPRITPYASSSSWLYDLITYLFYQMAGGAG